MIKIFSKYEKQKIVDQLNEQFGVEDVPGILIRIGGERIFLFQGDFSMKQIAELERIVPLERIGIYFAKEQNDQVRLSVDGVHVLQDQIKKNIFELSEEQVEDWMLGRELNVVSGKKGFVVMKYGDDFLGTGKASEQKITNFIPKNRRLKEKSR